MSNAHTPGPWTAKFTSGAGLSVHADVSKALGPRYSHDCPIYHTASDSVGLSIAYELWTQFPRAEWEAMQQANARLISAAPELLEALRNLLDGMEASGGWRGDEELFNAGMAAVAKATGERA